MVYPNNQPHRADPALHHMLALQLASQNLLNALLREHPRIVAQLIRNQTQNKGA